jgi:hypothetical protein
MTDEAMSPLRRRMIEDMTICSADLATSGVPVSLAQHAFERIGDGQRHLAQKSSALPDAPRAGANLPDSPEVSADSRGRDRCIAEGRDSGRSAACATSACVRGGTHRP